MTTQAAYLANILISDTDPALTALLVKANESHRKALPIDLLGIDMATGGDASVHDDDLLIALSDGSAVRWPLDLDPHDGAFSIMEPRLWINDNWEVTCEKHAGAYLRTQIAQDPARTCWQTPITWWSVASAADIADISAVIPEGAALCETCRYAARRPVKP